MLGATFQVSMRCHWMQYIFAALWQCGGLNFCSIVAAPIFWQYKLPFPMANSSLESQIKVSWISFTNKLISPVSKWQFVGLSTNTAFIRYKNSFNEIQFIKQTFSKTHSLQVLQFHYNCLIVNWQITWLCPVHFLDPLQLPKPGKPHMVWLHGPQNPIFMAPWPGGIGTKPRHGHWASWAGLHLPAKFQP